MLPLASFSSFSHAPRLAYPVPDMISPVITFTLPWNQQNEKGKKKKNRKEKKRRKTKKHASEADLRRTGTNSLPNRVMKRLFKEHKLTVVCLHLALVRGKTGKRRINQCLSVYLLEHNFYTCLKIKKLCYSCVMRPSGQTDTPLAAKNRR